MAAGFLLVIVSVARIAFVDTGELAMASSSTTKDKNDDDKTKHSEQLTFVSAGIRVHREVIDGRNVLWASPADNDRGSIKGLLFLAHGCGHSNLDWFSKKFPECKDCVGLPEEAAIVQTALDLGLVAIATSSSDWTSKCWSGFDVTPVALVLNELWHRFSQEEVTELGKQPTRRVHQQVESQEAGQNSTLAPKRLPLYAFGASSGGAFVSSLASPLLSRFGIRLDGFVSQIAVKITTPKEDKKEPHNLCKVYVTMNKDTKTDRSAQERVEKCQSSKRKRNRCKHIRLPHVNIKPSYFSDRIQGVSKTESYEMVKVLTKGGFITPDTGALIEDPRKSHKDWSRALKKASKEKSSSLSFSKRGDALVADKSPIFEVLNVAWGYHEMAREGVREALEFCLQENPTKNVK